MGTIKEIAKLALLLKEKDEKEKEELDKKEKGNK